MGLRAKQCVVQLTEYHIEMCVRVNKNNDMKLFMIIRERIPFH